MRIVTLAIWSSVFVALALLLSSLAIFRGKPLARALVQEWPVGHFRLTSTARSTETRTVQFETATIEATESGNTIAADLSDVRWERRRLLPDRGIVESSEISIGAATVRLDPSSLDRTALARLPETFDIERLTVQVGDSPFLEWQQVVGRRTADDLEIRFLSRDAKGLIRIPFDPTDRVVRQLELDGGEWQVEELSRLFDALDIRSPLGSVYANGRIDLNARAEGERCDVVLQHDPSTIRFEPVGLQLRFASGTFRWNARGPVRWLLQRAIADDQTAIQGQLELDDRGHWRGTLGVRVERREVRRELVLPERATTLLSSFGRRLDFDGEVRIDGRLDDGWGAIAEVDGQFGFRGDPREIRGDVQWIRSNRDYSVRGHIDAAQTFGWNWPASRFSGSIDAEGRGSIDGVADTWKSSGGEELDEIRWTLQFETAKSADGAGSRLRGRLRSREVPINLGLGLETASGYSSPEEAEPLVAGGVDVDIEFVPPRPLRQVEGEKLQYRAQFTVPELSFGPDVIWLDELPAPRLVSAKVDTRGSAGRRVEIQSLRLDSDRSSWRGSGTIDISGRWHLDLLRESRLLPELLPYIPQSLYPSAVPDRYEYDGLLFRADLRRQD